MKKIVLICFVLILEINAAVIAQDYSSSHSNKGIEESYRSLLSEDFLERNQAVFFLNNLKRSELNEMILQRAAELLKKEFEREINLNALLMSGKSLPDYLDYLNSEEYGSYHNNLCSLAGKSEKTSLTLLVNDCPIPEVLVNYGDAAAKLVMDKFQKTDNPIGKMNAINVLAEMLKPKKEGYVAGGELRNEIKKTLIKSASHEDAHIRQTAVRALGDSQDEDVIPILDNIAKHDQHLVRKKDKSGNIKKEIYPIREEAQKAINKIKNTKVGN